MVNAERGRKRENETDGISTLYLVMMVLQMLCLKTFLTARIQNECELNLVFIIEFCLCDYKEQRAKYKTKRIKNIFFLKISPCDGF